MIFGTVYNTGDGDDAVFFPDHHCLLCFGRGRSTKGDLCVVCVGYGWLIQRPAHIPREWSAPRRACKANKDDLVYHDLDPSIDPLGDAQRVLKDPPSTVVGKYRGSG